MTCIDRYTSFIGRTELADTRIRLRVAAWKRLAMESRTLEVGSWFDKYLQENHRENNQLNQDFFKGIRHCSYTTQLECEESDLLDPKNTKSDRETVDVQTEYPQHLKDGVECICSRTNKGLEIKDRKETIGAS